MAWKMLVYGMYEPYLEKPCCEYDFESQKNIPGTLDGTILRECSLYMAHLSRMNPSPQHTD